MPVSRLFRGIWLALGEEIFHQTRKKNRKFRIARLESKAGHTANFWKRTRKFQIDVLKKRQEEIKSRLFFLGLFKRGLKIQGKPRSPFSPRSSPHPPCQPSPILRGRNRRPLLERDLRNAMLE
jgi:hypothetical protein